MSKQNFYEDLDLKYIEIGIAMKRIDRVNPGSIPFNIPVLTPQMDNSSMKDTKVIQRDKSNIQNASVGSIEVSDIQMSNYIYITIPKELCALPSCEYHVKGTLNIVGTEEISGTTAFQSNLSNFHVRGTVVDSIENINDYVNGSGSESGSITYTGKESIDADTTVEGILSMIPTDKYRYIPTGSKWAICFIGGDINRPMVLGRIPD